LSDPENPDPVSPSKPARQGPPNHRGDVSWKSYSNHWNENHGTGLMVFAAILFAIGGTLIFYQQNRFRPVSFPSADAIQSAKTAEDNLAALDESGNALELGSVTADQSLAGGERLLDGETVSLRVTGASSPRGRMRIAVYQAAEHFNDVHHADWKGDFAISDDGNLVCRIPLGTLPDQFAIAVYHDENNNSEFDRNALRIPTERYGFSNDARGKLGPPSFDEAVMNRPTSDNPIELEIR
jgi:uncharacterized protein (DUF2141 family)